MIRLNNPGNVRRVPGTVWEGQSALQTDSDFVTFVTPEYGIRAITRIFRSYKREGINTLSDAINRWAPPADHNDTLAYVADVCQRCNIQPTAVVDFDLIMPTLIRAIIKHENGHDPYSDNQINDGIALASS